MREQLLERVEIGRMGGTPGDRNGSCQLKCGTAHLRVIFSDQLGWDHVSVSLATRCPSWGEMCWVKQVFFDDHEVVMQLHPAASEQVNIHPNCLHLWRPQRMGIPLPPLAMV